MTTEEQLQDMKQEIGRMKRHSRWLLILAVGAIWSSGGLAQWLLMPSEVMAQPQGGKHVIRAHEFILVDDHGTARAILSVDEVASRLRLYDKQGIPRTVLTAADDTPGLFLADGRGKSMASLIASPETGTSLTLDDQRNRPRVIVSASNDGGILHFMDEQERVRVMLSGVQGVRPLNILNIHGGVVGSAP